MTDYIRTNHLEYPKIDTAQMIEVDRLMIEEYQIELLQRWKTQDDAWLYW